jgi:hypothetical protein
MRTLVILALCAGSVSCASVHIQTGPQRPFYELRHQAPPGRVAHSARKPKGIFIQFTRSLP